MSPAEWKAIASIESSLNPQSNVNQGTQYKGLFQIGSRGAGSEWATHGSGDIYNAMDNATAAANLAAENNAGFQKAFGRAPTPIETYMMHQQGLGFFTKGALTNVEGNLPPEDRTPENMTHNGLMAYYANKMANRANQFRDPNDPNEISYSYQTPGGPGSSDGTTPSGGTKTAAGGSTETSSDDTGTGDYASAMSKIANQIAQQGQQTQPMQPMQMVQPMMTPGMIRAKQMAAAMLSLQQQQAGITPPTPPGGGSTT